MKTLFKELFSNIGFLFTLTILVPYMIIDMKINPKKWEKFFEDDPIGDPDNSFYYR